MEQLIIFNGVKVVLTTGERMSEVQSFADEADVIISLYEGAMRVLRHPRDMIFTIGNLD